MGVAGTQQPRRAEVKIVNDGSVIGSRMREMRVRIKSSQESDGGSVEEKLGFYGGGGRMPSQSLLGPCIYRVSRAYVKMTV